MPRILEARILKSLRQSSPCQRDALAKRLIFKLARVAENDLLDGQKALGREK